MRFFAVITQQQLPPIPQAVAQEIVQIVNRVDLLDGFVDVILDAAVFDRICRRAARSMPANYRRAVGRRSLHCITSCGHPAYVDIRFHQGRETDTSPPAAFGENPGHVSMALEAIAIDQREYAVHLPLVVDVFGEDVFVKRIAGRTMDEKEAVFPDRRGRSARNSQRFSLASRLFAGRFELAALQKMALSAGGLKPSGSNMAPWS